MSLEPKRPFITPGKGHWIYTQPETGFTARSIGLESLCQEIASHRAGVNSTGVMVLDMGVGWRERLMPDLCAQNPDVPCWDKAKPRPSKASLLAQQGRQLWGELHALADAYAPDKMGETVHWLAQFEDRIPRYGCPCRRAWKMLVRKFPPDLTSREAFVMWTRHAHDAVNRKLGRPFFEPSSVDSPLANMDLPR